MEEKEEKQKKQTEKESKITGKITRLDTVKKDENKKRFTAEVASKEATAAKVVAKNTPPPVEAVAEENAAPESAAAETQTEG